MNKEEYTAKLLNEIIAFIEQNRGEEILSSIVLTGSFGRGEPTWEVDADGNAILKSDVEIALVRKPSVRNKEALDLCHKLWNHFQEDLSLMVFSERRIKNAHNLNHSLWETRYKTIFTFDIFNGSKTIWGKDFLKSKRITIDAIDPYEAKRIVGNRIGELMYLTEDEGKNDDYTRKQWKGKVMLAICSAWLVIQKEYVSGYHSQYDRIIDNDAAKKELGGDFIDDYKKTFEFLRESGIPFEVSDASLRKYVERISELFDSNGIKQPKVNNIARIIKNTLRYIKTGCKFGFVHFENNIISSLISQFEQGETERLRYTAQVWHNSIY